MAPPRNGVATLMAPTSDTALSIVTLVHFRHGLEAEVDLEVSRLPAAANTEPARRLEDGHDVVDDDLAAAPAHHLPDA